MEMKKRSLVARRNRSLEKTGCVNCGNWFKSKAPPKAVKLLKRTINSKVTGMLAGRLKSGLPLMMWG